MKTSLFHLILNITALLLAHVSQHFGEHPLQRIVAYFTTMRAIRILNGLVTVVADVEGGGADGVWPHPPASVTHW